jgi:hypothetical protein
MSMNGQDPRQQGAEQAMRDQVSLDLLHAIHLLTQKGTMAQDTRESQALVVLDPTVIAPAGVGPEVIAKSTPQRPAETARRKAITKSKDAAGNTRYEMES